LQCRTVFLALVVTLIGGACSGGGESGAPIDDEHLPSELRTTSSTGTTTVPPWPSAVELPTLTGPLDGTFFAAWNAGDLDTYWSFFAPGATWNAAAIGDGELEQYAEEQVALGSQVFFSECAQSSRRYASCITSYTNRFHGPAGFEWIVREQFWFNDEGEISAYRGYGADPPGVSEFEEAFVTWVMAGNPDIAREDMTATDPVMNERLGALLQGFLEQSDDYPLSERTVPDPVFAALIDGVEIYNAAGRQLDLVAWALEAFDNADLERPRVERVTFPPTLACSRGFTGIASHGETASRIELCLTVEVLTGTTEFPLAARRAALHELAHVWIRGFVDEFVQDTFIAMQGLDAWTGAETWQDNGSEQAAELLMWGLMDTPIVPRLPGSSCESRAAAFGLLAGTAADQRTDDCTDEPIDYTVEP